MIKVKTVSLILILLLVSNKIWSQVVVYGTVQSKEDHSPLPGVNVVEKGTLSGTVTSQDGSFNLTVSHENSTLIFSFVGQITQEIKLNGRNHIDVQLKTDCIRDIFDHQKIGVYLNSGVINTPIGGRFEFSFPAFLHAATLKTGISYQTNLNESDFVNANIALSHFILKCNFDMDVIGHYRKIHTGPELNASAYSIETNLNFNRLKLILGYSNINLKKKEINDNHLGSGILLGAGTWIDSPLRLTIQGKVSIYKDLFEYQGEITRQFKRINTFARFYKLDSFTELSLGLGVEMTYRFKKQRVNK